MHKKTIVLTFLLAGIGLTSFTLQPHSGSEAVVKTVQKSGSASLASHSLRSEIATTKAEFSKQAPLASTPQGEHSAPPIPAGISPDALKQIEHLQTEKKRRTPAQKRTSSRLLYAVNPRLGQATGERVRSNLQKDDADRVLVDVSANITESLLKSIEATGASILNQFPEYHTLRAWLPLQAVEKVAALDGVTFVKPAVRAKAHAGSVTSQGDVAHGANLVRSNLGVSGKGVKVGVLSDNLLYLAQSQAAAELGSVSTLTGQAGSGQGEGTAMLEIIHDLAPDATLYFATAMSSPASFARNIKNLQAAGCDIIVDDVGYFDESPFQDDIIAQAVNSVTAKGALYFSAAGNSGSKSAGRSSTWEGDFSGGNKITEGTLHNFGSASYNTILSTTYQNYAALFWSDPLGGSRNDYDLYVLDSTGSRILAASDDYQGGTQDPYELIDSVSVGERIVVVLSAGSPRFLHLDTGGAPLAISTTGSTRGHNCAKDAFCVAAIDASGNRAFVGGGTNPEESFSSDGPRRTFYTATGTALTPGNFLASGGELRQKPDIAAADGVRTSVPGFSPFYGTSAAAPHAAALAALIKSAKPGATTAEIRKALTSGTIDNDATGWDANSGFGIVTVPLAIEVLVPTKQPTTNVAAEPAQLRYNVSPTGDIEVRVKGTGGANYSLESSTNLVDWVRVQLLTSMSLNGFVTKSTPEPGEHCYFRATAIQGVGI